MSVNLYVARYAAWALGIESAEAWNEWAEGKRAMQSGPEAPGITFTDPLFRRRLSQISKMTIQVVHDLLPVKEHTKMLFLSFRGELAKQYTINKMLIRDGALMPAAFSLSVFNAPIALASMACGLKGGYTALYPGNGSLAAGVAVASAMALSGKSEELLVVYADELVPPEYVDLFPGSPPPFAFGFVLTAQPSPGAVPFSAQQESAAPEDVLKGFILSGKCNAAP